MVGGTVLLYRWLGEVGDGIVGCVVAHGRNGDGEHG